MALMVCSYAHFESSGDRIQKLDNTLYSQDVVSYDVGRYDPALPYKNLLYLSSSIITELTPRNKSLAQSMLCTSTFLLMAACMCAPQERNLLFASIGFIFLISFCHAL